MHPRRDAPAFPGTDAVPWSDPSELPALIARYDAVVSMRYHGVLLAALAGRPSVALAHEGKVAALAAGVFVIFASGWAYARSLSRLLATATEFTRQIAAGNLGTPLAPGNPVDEIGALRFSLEATRRNLVGLARDVHCGIADTAANNSALSSGSSDLRHAIEVFRIRRGAPRPYPGA